MTKACCNKKPAFQYPNAKKGKVRLVAKANLTKKPIGQAAQAKAWKAVPYVKNAIQVRIDQLKYKRTLKDLLQADDMTIVKLLTEDGFLPDWSVMQCPWCNKGKVTGLQCWGSRRPQYRCRRLACHKFILPEHLHPIFTSTRGPEGHSLGVQASALLLRLANVQLSAIHILLGINHKALERMSRNLDLVRKNYVEEKQQTMSFGGKAKTWTQVEADEAVFDKFLVPAEEAPTPTQAMKWEQWLGLVARGRPSSLVLLRLSPVMTKKRAPGPGAVRKDEWCHIAEAWLKNKRVILHTDSARSYRTRMPGLLHDSVVHQKKKVRRAGKWVWQQPTCVRLVTHKLPCGKKIQVKAGTQIVDRAWKFLKQRVKVNQHAKCGSVRLQAMMRSAQYEYWHRGCDLWLSTGELMTWYMRKIAVSS